MILNGANYDPWMDKLLAAAPRPGRMVINAAQLTGRKAGDNPHLWYDPGDHARGGNRARRRACAKPTARTRPTTPRGSSQRSPTLDRITQRVAQLKAKHAGAPVTATEPVFGPMAEALGLTMRNERFQLAMMNDTEPSARDVAAFESDLKERKVKVLIYNSQVSEKLTERLRRYRRPGQGAGGRRHRNDAGQCLVPGLGARRARRARQGADRAELVSVVALDHVTLRIGGRTVLSDVSFEIEAGEFIGVLGPNGAGKTTLDARNPRAAAAERRQREGVRAQAPQRGNPAIGYLPQLRTVLPDLRVRGRDFIASSLNGERWGLPSLSQHDRGMIEETLDAVGARDLAARPLSEMSGGERQRLLLAQALIGSPKLLLLDEPLISLDARHQEVAIDVVRKVCRERKITVLFSAHELNQLLGTLDRVLYLGNGQAVLGTVDEVVTAPVLSRLYGTEIQVLRADGHIFVMSRGPRRRAHRSPARPPSSRP